MTSTPHADVVCLGESMVTFLPSSRSGRLADAPSFDRTIGGAESNVACTLARAGHSARWLSRVGADGFGDHLVEAIAAHGVDVTAVQRDPARPTGIYFRTEGERATTLPQARAGAATATAGTGTDTGAGAGAGAGTQSSAGTLPVAEVLYYRTASAASVMSPATVDLAAARSCRILHLTGITAALSADCLALIRALTARTAERRPLVSFDVNYRVGLWRQPEAPARPEVLLDLARGADIVFVGEDEAEAAWGVTGGPEALCAALPEPAVLVVKQGADGATACVRESEADGEYGEYGAEPEHTVHVPSLGVEVVASVGAGDAFAAGFLSATLRGLPVRDRLRHGHLAAAAALTVPEDLGEPPSPEHADRLAALGDEAWAGLRLGPGWTTAPASPAANGRNTEATRKASAS